MNFLRNFFSRLKDWGERLQDVLLLVIRLFWGYSFFTIGYGKLASIGSASAFFASYGFPFPTFSAYLVGSVECVGGLLFLLGLASRFSAFLLGILMIGAYLTVHLEAARQIFQNPQFFLSQTPFLFLFAALLVFCFGPGKFSLDAIFKRGAQ
ncbi:DoxX family protein [Parachlamydia sp. AcF125]|uniref:DoxX family protein n=1 Tax=Parachlamydia sp. AcF125 TaxID=2795736 RepID=UPI001BCA0684|nr:DoxX family protein [Parachlamydia sp. AcF125]MBS4168440.1 putative oxidoreductase CatD [Parachlamydia sp. AcF125]